MAISKELLTDNLGFILIAFIIIIAIILIVLKIVEKRLYKKIIIRKTSRDNFYREEVKKVIGADPRETISNLEKLSKDFFKEAFDMKKSAEYSELEKIFKQKKNIKAIEFCKIMNHVLYSGKEENINYVQRLAGLLTNIIENTHIMTDEEKEELKNNQAQNKNNTTSNQA